jgi:hypothetical protein
MRIKKQLHLKKVILLIYIKLITFCKNNSNVQKENIFQLFIINICFRLHLRYIKKAIFCVIRVLKPKSFQLNCNNYKYFEPKKQLIFFSFFQDDEDAQTEVFKCHSENEGLDCLKKIKQFQSCFV